MFIEVFAEFIPAYFLCCDLWDMTLGQGHDTFLGIWFVIKKMETG